MAFDHSGNLYVDGQFATAGTNASYCLAGALLSQSSRTLSLATFGPRYEYHHRTGHPNYSYALDPATNLERTRQLDAAVTNTLTNQSFVFTNPFSVCRLQHSPVAAVPEQTA